MYIWSALPRSLNATFRDAAHPKAAVRLSALRDLVRWSSSEERERCVQKLVAILTSDSDVEVRAASALALADAEAREALDVLLQAATSGHARTRQLALLAVGELSEPDCAPALTVVASALREDAPALRFQALVAAGRLLPARELLPELLQALRDADARLRYLGCRIAEERYFDAGDPPPAALAERLEYLLSDVDVSVAVASAVVLARRGSERARAVLVRELNRRNAFAQLEDEQAAIDLCAELGLDAARPGLRARAFGGLWGSSSPLAFQARVALARLGDERAVAQILRGLSSWSRGLRNQAVAAAGQARLKSARPRLIEMQRADRRVDHHAVAEAIAAIDGESPQQNPLVSLRPEY